MNQHPVVVAVQPVAVNAAGPDQVQVAVIVVVAPGRAADEPFVGERDAGVLHQHAVLVAVELRPHAVVRVKAGAPGITIRSRSPSLS